MTAAFRCFETVFASGDLKIARSIAINSKDTAASTAAKLLLREAPTMTTANDVHVAAEAAADVARGLNELLQCVLDDDDYQAVRAVREKLSLALCEALNEDE